MQAANISLQQYVNRYSFKYTILCGIHGSQYEQVIMQQYSYSSLFCNIHLFHNSQPNLQQKLVV